MRLKVKDRMTLGVLAGLVGGIPARLMDAWLYKRGYLDFRWEDLAASVFYPGGHPKDRHARWTGRIANQFILAMSGVTVTYALSATGRDKAALKGAGMFGLEWLGLYGLSQRVGLYKVRKPLSDLIALADHMLSGATIATLVTTLGDDSIFPDSKQPLPLVGPKVTASPSAVGLER